MKKNMDPFITFFHLKFESKTDNFYTSVFGIIRKDWTKFSKTFFEF